jgi:hypothetical protein
MATNLALYGAETTALQAESLSFPEKAAAGLTATTVSGLASIWNTGVDVIKWGGGDVERWSTVETLKGIDDSWAGYYQQNKETIDIAGFVAGSLIPGAVAVKALKAVQAGNSFGAVGRGLGYFADKQVTYLKAANAEFASGGSAFTRWNANYVKSIAAGTADNILQAAVAEAAVVATMKASPLLDEKTWGSIARDSAETALWFGGGFGLIGSYMSATRAAKQVVKLSDEVEAGYSAMAQQEKLALPLVGDKAAKAYDELASLPKEVLDKDKLLNFSFKVQGKVVEQEVDIGQRLSIAHQRAATKAFDSIRGEFTSAVKDGEVANALADHMLGMVRAAREPGESLVGSKVHQMIGDFYAGLKDATRLTSAHSLTEAAELAAKPKPKFTGWPEARAELPALPGAEVKPPKPEGFFNTRTGNIANEVYATAADLKELTPAELAKHKFSLKDFKEHALDKDGTILQTARNYWVSTQKSFKGLVHSDDFAVVDEILAHPEKVEKITDITIRTKSFGDLPFEDFATSSFRDQVLSWKITALEEALSQPKIPNLDLLARKLNVTEKWIEDTVANNFARIKDGSSRDLTTYGKLENLRVEYLDQVPSSWGRQGSGWLDWESRVTIAREHRERVAASTLGEHFQGLIQLERDAVQKEANRLGTGASLFKAADAGYDNPLGQAMQKAGVVARKAIQEFTKKAHDQISTQATQLMSNKQAVGEVSAILQRLRNSASADGFVLHELIDGPVLVREALTKSANAAEDIANAAAQAGSKDIIRIAHKETFNFLKSWDEWQKGAVSRHVPVINATGRTTNIGNSTALYAPPIDTRKLQHFAFVRSNDGQATSMIVANSAKELQAIAHNVDPGQATVIFKEDTARFFKARGEYEFDRGLNRMNVNSEVARAGRLSQYVPNMRPEETIGEFLAFMERKETQLVRDSIELKYGQEFAELRGLGAEHAKAQTSKLEWMPKVLKRAEEINPYEDYIKTALDLSKKAEYPFLMAVDSLVDTAGKALGSVKNALMGNGKGLDWEGASDAMARAGLKGAISKELFYSAQAATDRNVIKRFGNISNTILATTQLGLDAANALVNIISTPIRLAAEMEAVKKLGATLPTVLTPDGKTEVSTTKLLANAMLNYWKPEAAKQLDRFAAIGAVHKDLKFHRQLADDIATGAMLPGSKLAGLGEAIAEKGGKWTGNEFAEKFTRFVAADVMDQLVDPLVKSGKLSQAQADGFILTFTNRVQGNYHANQRPIAFQGTVGSSISLFQTYAFGMYQQIGRFIEDGNKRALFTMAGLQTGIYGLQGLPMFEAINTHLLAKYSTNPDHKDMYSKVGGTELGDWLLYGSASALPFDGAPALYSRGDMQPRHITVLPHSPMDIPYVQAYGKMAGMIGNMSTLLGNGAPVKESILFSLEHNGLSRPLAGFAQLMQGYSTNNKGNIISAQHDLVSLASVTRVLGARPMDEALAVQHNYRQNQFQLWDKARLEDFGTAVKLRLRNGEVPSDEEYEQLLTQYASKGGRVENFSKAMNRWTRDSQESVVNQMMEKNRNKYNAAMIEIMGGRTLENLQPQEVEQAVQTDMAVGQ